MQHIRRLLPFVVIVVILASLTACGTASPNTGTLASPQPTSAPTSTPTSTPTLTPTPHGHFHVGDAVNVGNIWQITIVSAKAGGTQSYLKPGHTFLNIVVEAKNVSAQEQNISSFDFTLRDSSGESQVVTYDPDAPVSVLSGKVESGSPIKGGLTFSVSMSEHQFQLFFEVSVIASGQTIWDIHV
jgi:Domain of unknown function (DUF4352)